MSQLSSDGKVTETKIPRIEKPNITKIGKGAAHSFTIGATMVMDLAIMPQVPTDVFLLLDGKILSSVKDA